VHGGILQTKSVRERTEARWRARENLV